ncbi:MAG: sigma 54-interacting transcriptional regulator [Acidobacteriota bacterium]
MSASDHPARPASPNARSGDPSPDADSEGRSSGVRSSSVRPSSGVQSVGDDSLRYCLRGEINGVDQVYALRRGDSRLGALDSNDVVLPLAGVSRIHARLRVTSAGKLQIEDLESKNGTFIEGRRIRKATVEPETDLRFGPVALRFEEYHRDDHELAITFDYSSTQPTAAFPVQEVPRRTGTHTSSMSRQWLVLADAFQERLMHARAGDFTSALGVLVEELHLQSVCILELDPSGAPIVLHAAGRVDEASTRELASVLEPLISDEPPSEHLFASRNDVRGASVRGESLPPTALTVAGLRSPGHDPLALALWGKFPGRRDSEILLRLLLRMLDAARPGARSHEAVGEEREFPGLVVPKNYVYGRSDVMRQLYGLMQTLAQGDLPILIIGETGVGKEYLSKILHDSSPRRRGPFVAINCAAIPSELLEAELFGIGDGVATGVTARKGRFQLADGGTLFLDEIGDMSADLQAKLLRALQEKEVHPVGKDPVDVDVRVLAATNQELIDRIQDGSFRADLYYRLAGYVLEIPPLRERKDDIPPLVEHFLRTCAEELNRSIRGLTVHALRLLTEYPWPGNVRELSNEVRRAVYLCPDNRTIESSTLSKTIRDHYAQVMGGVGEAELVPGAPRGDGDASKPLPAPLGLGLDSLNLEQLENQAILEALRRCQDNQVQAAKLLGISRQKLRRRMERMGQLKPKKRKN